MGKRRGNAHRFQFNKPLSMPDSKIVYRCYATHGDTAAARHSTRPFASSA
jgi:hypothetical protein